MQWRNCLEKLFTYIVSLRTDEPNRWVIAFLSSSDYTRPLLDIGFSNCTSFGSFIGLRASHITYVCRFAISIQEGVYPYDDRIYGQYGQCIIQCLYFHIQGFVHVRIWFPQFPGVVMQSDQELIIMCKPPEPTIIENKAAGFAGSL